MCYGLVVKDCSKRCKVFVRLLGTVSSFAGLHPNRDDGVRQCLQLQLGKSSDRAQTWTRNYNYANMCSGWIGANSRPSLNQHSQNDVLGRSVFVFCFYRLGVVLLVCGCPWMALKFFPVQQLWSRGIHPPCYSHCHHSSLLCHVEEGRRSGTRLVKGSLKSARCACRQPNLAEQPTIHIHSWFHRILPVGCFYLWMPFQFAVIGVCLRIGHRIPLHRSAMYVPLSPLS